MKVRLKRASSESDINAGRESPSSVADVTANSCLPVPIRIKVVDAVPNNHTDGSKRADGSRRTADGLRPFILYYILATRRDGGEGCFSA